MSLTFGSLFAGAGGMDLGLHNAGLECRWQVEIDEFCRGVLAKHWPAVPKWDDVKTFPPEEGDWAVDVIAGGFPCQDISYAGCGAGLDGARSGLWFEMLRIIRLLRPSYVIVENVAALLVRGLERVLGDLADSGFDAAWEVLSACAFGAPHMRRRLFIVAYANGLDGRPRVRNPLARQDRTLQAIDGSPRARAGWQARLANPSELYGGANGIPFGRNRNRAIGNSVSPPVAQWIGERIVAAALTDMSGEEMHTVKESDDGHPN
jgi:DNA (cytosine-5)-methyltransferase 1